MPFISVTLPEREAISMKNGKARIDATLCVGCGVCEQLCPFGAIGEV